MTAEILAATEHLVLRRMTNDAAAALAAYRSDPVQARYQSWETPYPGSSPLSVVTGSGHRR
jgi:aminoglycoside 6'-N-acetyltransferase